MKADPTHEQVDRNAFMLAPVGLFLGRTIEETFYGTKNLFKICMKCL